MGIWKTKTVDPLLEELGKSVLVQLGDLRQGLATLRHAFELSSSERVDALRLEKRIIVAEATLKQISALRDEDVARYASTLEQIRGQITGTQRRSRNGNQDQILELGQKLVDAMSDPRKLQQVISELSQLLPSASVSPIMNGQVTDSMKSGG